jgi:hypothetical protein
MERCDSRYTRYITQELDKWNSIYKANMWNVAVTKDVQCKCRCKIVLLSYDGGIDIHVS